MTYRERREAQAARLQGWAEKRQADATRVLNFQPELRHDWAFITQPGHIPERARMNARDERAFASLKKAGEMNSRAIGIEQQLDRSIYSDDPDATERLQERIEALEAEQATLKAANVAYRKEHKAELAAMGPYMRNQSMPAPTWHLSNLSANIRRNKERLAQIRAQQATPHAPRTITARRKGRCDYCDGSILPEVMQITEVEPHRWLHFACANDVLSRARDGWTPENSVD